ncbi:MAG: DEAD/DEAH box helicase [Candidatus Aramenus sp.]|jgi:DEAD/DEAH box helicase domain-containing protein|nr:DEAD/DEAH box helicase [Candidatus Aramenus sp.]
MDILEEVKERLAYFNASVAHVHVETALEPDAGAYVDELPVDPKLKEVLKGLGFARLYKFQEEAVKEILKGKNVLIVSGTGTGKTEAFLIPVLQFALKGERSVLVYPTKALARDQLSRVTEFARGLGVGVAVLDGDTPREERKRIYSDPPEVLITNPDMIHRGLTLSPDFRKLIRGSEHFVFDELHVYEGVLGSHLRMVVDRIREFQGDVQVVSSSATIGASPYMLEGLFGLPGEVIYGSTRRKGTAFHVLVNSNGISRWTLSAFLASFLVKKGMKVLVFADSQQMVELTAKIAQRFGVSLEVHRAGILPEERMKVEERLRRGEIPGVVATQTLELGIDVGSIDAVVMAENPPSYSKYLQRAGRAGRRNRTGYVFTVMGEDPIDSYFLRRPEEFFNRKLSPLPFDISNLEVVKVHALAYLLEKKAVKLDEFPELWRKALLVLEKEGVVKVVNGVAYSTRKAMEVFQQSSLRSSGSIVKVYHGDKKVAERELPVALYDLYPNAVYLASKRTYVVESLDLARLVAKVKRVEEDLPYYTKPLYSVDLKEFKELESRKAYNLPVKYGEVSIEISVRGYVVHDIYSKRERSAGEFEYDEPITFSYTTKGMIIKHPLLSEFSLVDGIEAYHATEHVLIHAGRVVAGASLTDLSGISYPSGHVVIYDSSVGGSGVAKLLYERLEDAYEVAKDIVGKCDCEDGCPKCVYDPYCGNNNKFLSRRKSFRLISEVMKGEAPKEEDMWGDSVR